MAVATIDTQSGNMMLMAEWNRLYPGDAGVVGIRRPLDLSYYPESKANDQHCANYRGTSYRICAAMEYLAHLAVIFPTYGYLQSAPFLQF